MVGNVPDSEVIITVVHQPFAVQLVHVGDRFPISTDQKADRERATSVCSTTSATKRAKRQVTVATCKMWQREFDHDYQILSWLQYDADKTAGHNLSGFA